MIEGMPNLSYRSFDGQSALATKGEPAYGEPVADGWRRWSTRRSKLAGLIDRGIDLGLTPEAHVLYLGAASGTTVSHLADLVEVVYAIDIAPRPMADLVDVAEPRTSIIPLLKDARQPDTYAHVVEDGIDLIVQDVATRDQAQVALNARRFLAADGRLALAIKARSEDVTAAPSATFDAVLSSLESGYRVEERVSLEPDHLDHLGVLATPRSA